MSDCSCLPAWKLHASMLALHAGCQPFFQEVPILGTAGDPNENSALETVRNSVHYKPELPSSCPVGAAGSGSKCNMTSP